jgi:hypothetical protein
MPRGAPFGTGLLDLLPTPARLYIEAMSGKQSPITEADFSKDELNAMRELMAVGNHGGGTDYGTYERAIPSPSLFNSPETTSVGLSGLLTPQGRVANSLGQFQYNRDPEGATITDQYDFNPMFKNESVLNQVLLGLGTGGFSPMHTIGEYFKPPGKGRPVKIRVPNE